MTSGNECARAEEKKGKWGRGKSGLTGGENGRGYGQEPNRGVHAHKKSCNPKSQASRGGARRGGWDSLQKVWPRKMAEIALYRVEGRIRRFNAGENAEKGVSGGSHNGRGGRNGIEPTPWSRTELESNLARLRDAGKVKGASGERRSPTQTCSERKKESDTTDRAARGKTRGQDCGGN